jgi:hypothetical protein
MCVCVFQSIRYRIFQPIISPLWVGYMCLRAHAGCEYMIATPMNMNNLGSQLHHVL